MASSANGITYYGAQLPFLFKTLPLYSMDACLSLSECGCILDTSCGWCSDCGDGAPCAMLAHELRPGEGPAEGRECSGTWDWDMSESCKADTCAISCAQKATECTHIRNSNCGWCIDGTESKALASSQSNQCGGTWVATAEECPDKWVPQEVMDVIDSSICVDSIPAFVCQMNFPECKKDANSGDGSPVNSNCEAACSQLNQCRTAVSEACSTVEKGDPRRLYCPEEPPVNCKDCSQAQQDGDQGCK